MEVLIFKTICKNEIKNINKYSSEIITNEDLEFLNNITKYDEYTKSKDSLKYYFLNEGVFKLSIKNNNLNVETILNFDLSNTDQFNLYILIDAKRSNNFYYIINL
jgi:hypothetical protein